MIESLLQDTCMALVLESGKVKFCRIESVKMCVLGFGLCDKGVLFNGY